jgi:hypothetical protein
LIRIVPRFIKLVNNGTGYTKVILVLRCILRLSEPEHPAVRIRIQETMQVKRGRRIERGVELEDAGEGQGRERKNTQVREKRREEDDSK